MFSIIGGSGFIGTSLSKRLFKSGNSIRIFDIKASEAFRNSFNHTDVRNIDDLRKAIPKESIIINLAAEHRDDVLPRSLYKETNVHGAKNITIVAREKI